MAIVAQDIRVHHVEIRTTSNTTTVNVPLQGGPFDASKCFVFQNGTANHKWSSQSAAFSGPPGGQSGVASICGWFTIAAGAGNSADVTFHDPWLHTGEERYATAEVWEYVGPPGGPNEFIVRDVDSRTFTPATPNSANEIIPWSFNSIYDHIIFTRGIELFDLPNSNRNAAMEIVAYTLAFFGDRFIYQRGLSGDNTFDWHYSAVEFVGSNWTGSFVSAVPPLGVRTAFSLTAIGSPDVGDWSNAFIYVQKRQTANNRARRHGVCVWPGPSTTQVYAQAYDVTSESPEPLNPDDTFVAVVMANPDITVEHKNTIDGGESVHPGIPGGTNNTQTIDVPTAAGVPNDLPILSIQGSHYMNGVHNYTPLFQWMMRLIDDGAGGVEVEWFRARSAGDSENPGQPVGGTTHWAQQVIRFRGFAVDVDRVQFVGVSDGAVNVPVPDGSGAVKADPSAPMTIPSNAAASAVPSGSGQIAISEDADVPSFLNPVLS